MYEQSVFINCPFDKQYRRILERILFVLYFYEYSVQMSITESSSHDRLGQIIKMIRDCRYSIHDLSRHRSSKKDEFARFNMPFELGIDFGCIYYDEERGDKSIAILDSSPHAYDQHTSDLSGRDIFVHKNDPDMIFTIIPNWLSQARKVIFDAPRAIKGYYLEWETDYKSTLKDHGYDLRQINKVELGAYIIFLESWTKSWRERNQD